MQLPMSAPIKIVDYDPTWPAKFAAERQLLLDSLQPWLVGPIEHVGSTAIPGLRAKPVIDIMVAVETLPASRNAIPVLEALGYQYWPYKADVMHWLCKPSDEFRTTTFISSLSIANYGGHDLRSATFCGATPRLQQNTRHSRMHSPQTTGTIARHILTARRASSSASLPGRCASHER
jgi:GrpB-like predicted nucleotidyltransferase (UPF0157 family)